MLQTIDTTHEGFLCPQCHQDMSNMEMLQLHFQTVHMKQPGKGSLYDWTCTLYETISFQVLFPLQNKN
jgi:hypothetical protein